MYSLGLLGNIYINLINSPISNIFFRTHMCAHFPSPNIHFLTQDLCEHFIIASLRNVLFIKN
jgi:hypothetical protein